MKKAAIVILVMLFTGIVGRSAVKDYFFTQENLTYTEITGGTQLWSGTFDNDVSGAISIPTFSFNGTEYTSLYISANGFITFGSAPATDSYYPIYSTESYNGAIAPFGRDLAQAASGSPEVRYETVGTEFVVQWKDVRRKNITGEIISFQIRLDTVDYIIKIVYGGTISPGSSSSYPQVGMRGSSNTDFNNRYISSSGGNWINSTAGATNTRTMYFRDTYPGTVPSSGLTYTWQPLSNPTNFKATGISLSAIDLTWNKNSTDNNVMLAFNTTNTFGTPENGTVYSVSDPITGGGTVLFYGDGTSYNHTGLGTGTPYYYKIWSYDASINYSTGTTASARTAFTMPYMQFFNATTLPTEWSTTMTSMPNHGIVGTRSLSSRLQSGSTYAISPLTGSISASSYLSFIYRIIDYNGYPINATNIGINDKIEVQVSNDDGETFTTIHTINQSNHTATTDFTIKTLSLSAYNGDFVKIRFLATWGAGDYYIDIDNVIIEDGTNMVYGGSTSDQPNTANVPVNSTDKDILQLMVFAQKDASPLSVTSISFNTTGCTNAANDLDAAKVYYTATPEFSTDAPFGSSFSNPNGSFTITGSQALTEGFNYFWLAYDIAAGATPGNVIDAQCTELITSETATPKTPSILSPSGNRLIGATISGTKTVPGDYATIAEAVTALNAGSIGSGGVTINIAADYTENITTPIVLTNTGTSDNPIVFQKSVSGANPLVTRTDAGSISTSILGNRGDGIIILDGSDYVTFSDIDVTSSDQGIEYGYYLRKSSGTNGCKDVTIKNATITMTKGTSQYVVGFCAANSSSSVDFVNVTSAGGIHENIDFTGNNIYNTFCPIYLKGSPALYDQNFTVGKLNAGNTIEDFAGNSANTAYGIYVDYNDGSQISYNSINNLIGGGGGLPFTAAASGIYNNCSEEVSFTAEHNIITLTSVSSAINGIYNESTGTLNINSNTISLNNTTSSSSDYIFVNNFQSSATTSNNTTINSNYFTMSDIETTGNTYLIRNNNARVSPEVTTIQGNQSSSINLTGASGSFYIYYNASGATGTLNFSANNFTGINLTGSSSFFGVYSSTSSSHTQNVFDNIISNITGGTGATNVIHLLNANTRSVYGNSIMSISGGGIVNGIRLGTGSSPCNVYKNDIYDLSTSSSGTTSGLVNGILAEAGNTVYIYNNYVSDLKAPSSESTDAIRGISITSTEASSTIGAYYNSVYLDASSVGTNFGTSGLYHESSATSTTAQLDLRNNIIVNESTPAGTGKTVAFRRSPTSLNNYAATSNNNLLYAGNPGTQNLVFSNTDCQTIEEFQALVGPARDANSVSELPPFINTSTTPYNLHLQDGAESLCESGATAISSPIAINDDFDGDARATTPDIGADEFNGTVPSEVPEDYVFENTTLADGQTDCYNALNTITVAGSGTTVIFESGSSATLIAAGSISFLPGFHAQSGSYMSAYITTTGSFCDASPEPEIVQIPVQKSYKSESIEEEEAKEENFMAELSVKVYPNPTTGLVNVEWSGFEGPSQVILFNSLGVKLKQETVQENAFIGFNLTNYKKGVYFVKVQSGNSQKIQKIMLY